MAATLACATALSACSERGTTPPAPGGSGPYPNVGTVPPRPAATPTADRAAILGSLQRDRDSRYDDTPTPVDETRGSTIGTLVGKGQGRNDARAAASPAPEPRVEPTERVPGTPPPGGATVGAPPASTPIPAEPQNPPIPLPFPRN